MTDWNDFTRTVASTIRSLPDERFLVIEPRGGSPYVQVLLCSGDLVVELQSNEYLGGAIQWTLEQDMALARLGWEPPGASAAEVDSHLSTGSPNYLAVLDGASAPLRAARMIALAYRDVVKVQPEDLRLSGVGFRADEPFEPVLGPTSAAVNPFNRKQLR